LAAEVRGSRAAPTAPPPARCTRPREARADGATARTTSATHRCGVPCARSCPTSGTAARPPERLPGRFRNGCPDRVGIRRWRGRRDR
jgi:hypothetical protein